MAIVKMQKISIAAAKKHRKAILEQLQDMGLMELHEEQIEDVDLERMDTQAARNNFERAAQTLDMALKLLKEYAPEKNAGLSLFSEKKLIPRSDFQAHDSRASGVLTKAQKLVDLEKEIHELGAANLKDRATISGLTPWMSLDIQHDYSPTHFRVYCESTTLRSLFVNLELTRARKIIMCNVLFFSIHPCLC